jgi:phosphatidylserine/phosphatidylglycerophosphate/cardiolipin synthase-like enzyme
MDEAERKERGGSLTRSLRQAGSAIAVPSDHIREHAEHLATRPVSRRALAVAFSASTASSVEVLVEGASFYPPMLEDIASASSSVHINQFGFRPGVVGDAFADALTDKAAEGVPVRLVVDRQGSDPEGSTRAFYDRLSAAGIEVCVVRATQLRAPVGPLGSGGATSWNLGGLGHVDHRKFAVIDGNIGWVGGAGIEDHFQDAVRAFSRCSRARSCCSRRSTRIRDRRSSSCRCC